MMDLMLDSRKRETGIKILGKAPWGTHVCLFYENNEDLLDILVPYFKEGLENNEYCMWITSKPLTKKDAEIAAMKAIPDFKNYLKKEQIEIIPHDEWYLKENKFDLNRVLNDWIEKLDYALSKGYDGLRVTGNTAWLEKRDWKSFTDYEEEINSIISDYRMIAICTYSLEKCRPYEILDVIQNHQSALIRREGNWTQFKSMEQAKVEKKLNESEERFKYLVSSSPAIIYTCSPSEDFDATFISENIKNQTGYTPEEFLKNSGFWINNIHPDDRKRILTGLTELVEKDYLVHEYRFKFKDRTYHWMHDELRLINDKYGNPKEIIGFWSDITEQKEAEQKLKKSEERFKYLVSSSPSIIYTSKVSDNYDATFISDNVREKWGYEPEIFINDSDFWVNHVHPDDKDHVLETLSELFEKEHILYDYRFKLKDGTYKWMGDEVQLIKDKHGTPIETIGSVIDITERKNAEQKLKESESKLQRILSSIEDQITIIDKQFNIFYANDKAKEFYGSSIEGTKCYKLYHNRKNVCEDCQVAKTFLDGNVHHKECERFIKSGEKNFCWCISSVAARDEKGQPTLVVEVSRDMTEQKKAEEKIKHQTMLVESVSDAIISTDLDFNIISWNKAAELIYGWKAEEIIGKNIIDTIAIEYLYDDKDVVLEQFYEEGFWKGEVIQPHKYGTPINILAAVSMIKDITGKPIGVVTINRDITERKKADQNIKNSEKRYKHLANELEMILDHIPGIVVYKDTDNNLLRVNKFLADAHNLTKEQMEGKSSFDLYPKDQAQAYWRDDLEVIKTGLPKLNIVEPWEPEIGKRWVNTSKIPYIDESGSVKGIIAIAQDITEQKKAEEELKESKEKFRTIAEQSLLGLTIVQDGSVVFTNQAFSNILEYSVEEINRWSSKDTLKVIYEEDLPQVLKQLKARKKNDLSSILQYQCRILTKSKKLKWVEVISKPIIYQERTAIILSLIDITANKEAEEELKEISRLKSELLSRTSHELKTPLVSIKGYVDFLLNIQSDELDLQTISILNEIKRGCDRLESLIKDILETSKLESDTVELNKSLEDLSFLIRFCSKDLQGLIKARNHKIFIDIRDRMYTMFEKERIYEVIINLLSNAINYTPPNGKIRINSEINDNYYLISIKDNGIGLTEEEKSKLFKKFGKIERYGQGLDVISEGSGLGLYISKKIVKLHGGKIWVESKGMNKGSTFYFSLPIIKK